MAWARVWQIHGESNDPTEFQVDGDSNGTGTPTFSATKFNAGAQSIRNANQDRGAGYAFSTAARAFRCQAFINHNGLQSSAEVALFNLTTSSGARHRILWNSATSLVRLMIDGVEQSTTTDAAAGITPTDTWLQLGCVFWSDPTAGYFSFYIGSTRVLTFSGNTGAVSDGIVACYSGARIGITGWNNYAYFDDIYMDSSSTIEVDSVPQTRTFGIVKVNAAGSVAGMQLFGETQNHLAVDDTTPNGDTDYVFAESSGVRDMYNGTNFTVPPALAIKAVIPMITGLKTDAGTASQLRHVFIDASLNETLGTPVDLEVNYTRTMLGRFEKAPDGLDWTETKLNSGEFGLESAGSF